MTESKTPASGGKTLVTFVLDETSSMGAIKGRTIEAFNSYLDELQKEGDGILFNLIAFNSGGTRKVHYEVPVKQMPRLCDANYQPAHATPLIEAVTRTIHALDKALPSKTGVDKVVVSIQTDGEENTSAPEYTWDGLKALIEERSKAGWQFNFMGAGINAYQQGVRMGVAVGSTVSYDHTQAATTDAAFRSMGVNTASFSAGLASSTGYSASQKLASGDKYAGLVGGSLVGGSLVGGSPVGGLPSGVYGAPAVPAAALPYQPTTPKPSRDIDLGGNAPVPATPTSNPSDLTL